MRIMVIAVMTAGFGMLGFMMGYTQVACTYLMGQSVTTADVVISTVTVVIMALAGTGVGCVVEPE